MDVYEAITKRRSIRRFRDIPVPYETLERYVDAARQAPAARNNQVLEWLVIDDEKLLPPVYDTLSSWGGRPRAEAGPQPGQRPHAYIITLVDNEREKAFGRSRTPALYDIGMSAQNGILAALEQGVSACPFLSFAEPELRSALNILAKYDIGLVVALGYAAETSVAEEAPGSTEYWVDGEGVRHVPKRRLEDVLRRNGL